MRMWHVVGVWGSAPRGLAPVLPAGFVGGLGVWVWLVVNCIVDASVFVCFVVLFF